MASNMASSTLRTSRRPLSLLATHRPSSSISSSGCASVRWASIVPYTITATGPPAPPMTLEQVALAQQRKQQTLLEEQIQLEKNQRARQQLELRQQLASHRNKILEQQKAVRDGKSTAAVETSKAEGTQRDERLQARRDQSSTEQTSEATATTAEADAPMFVGTRRRSMFGYRGPEHNTLTAGVEEEETRYAELAQSQRRVLIAAEDRVRLAMMDYSPKEIDAMSPEQAHNILSPSSSSLSSSLSSPSSSSSSSSSLLSSSSTSSTSTSIEEDVVHSFDDVISPPTPTRTTASSSVELELDSCLTTTSSST